MAKRPTRKPTPQSRPNRDKSPAAKPAARRGAPATRPHRAAAMLDNAIHPRVKLGILTAIARRPMFPFIELAMWIGSTTSRLSTAIRELVRDGMIDVKKGYERNRPITQYSLSPEGEARLRVYLEHLAQIVNHSGLATVALKRD